jgi:hypothetical protein
MLLLKPVLRAKLFAAVTWRAGERSLGECETATDPLANAAAELGWSRSDANNYYVHCP